MFRRISLGFLVFAFVGLFPLVGQTPRPSDLYRSGLEALQRGDFKDAALKLLTLVDLFPQDTLASGAEYHGATALISVGDFRKALDLLQKYPRKYPDSPLNARLSYWRGAAYIGLQDWSAAAQEFEAQGRRTAELAFIPRSLQGAAYAYEKLEKNELADGAYTRLLGATTDAALYSAGLLRRGALRVGLKRFKEAQEDLTKVLVDYPQSASVPEAIFWLGESFWGQKDGEQARRFYQNYLTLNTAKPLHDKVLLRISEIARIQNPSSALPLLQTLVRDFPKSPLVITALTDLVDLYRQLGMDKELVGAYESLISKEKQPGELQKLFYNLGVAQLKMSQPALAAPWFGKASTGPDEALALEAGLQHGLVLLEAGKEDEGLRTLESYAAARMGQPLVEAALRTLASKYAAESFLEQRTRTYQSLVTHYSQSAQADEYHFGLGDALLQKRDLAGALSKFRQLLEAHPNSKLIPEALYKVGYIFVLRSEFSRAESYFFKVLEVASPQSELYNQALYSRAISFYNATRYDLAVASFQRLLRETPNNSRGALARYHLALSYIQLGQFVQAEEVLTYLKTNGTDPMENEKVFWALAENARRLGQGAQEVLRWKEYQTTFPQSARWSEAVFLQGQAQKLLGENEAALETWGRVKGSAAKEWQYQALYQRVLLQFEMGNEGGAWADWAKILVLDPRNPANEELYFRSAEQMESQAQWGTAQKAFEEFVKLFPSSTLVDQARVRGSLAQMKTESRDSGLTNLIQWMRDRGGRVDHETLSLLRLALDRVSFILLPQEFIAFYEELLGTLGDVGARELELAWVRFFQDTQPAASQLKLAALLEEESTPEFQGEVLLLMAGGYYRQGAWDEAEGLLKSLSQSSDTGIRLRALFMGARVLEAKGESRAAGEAWASISRLNWTLGDFRAEALWNAQRIYQSLGDGSLAQEYRQRLQKEMPQSTWARRND